MKKYFDDFGRLWYNLPIYHKNTNMSTPLGAHAASRKESRIEALRAYGIDPHIVDEMQANHDIAQKAKHRREITLEWATDLVQG